MHVFRILMGTGSMEVRVVNRGHVRGTHGRWNEVPHDGHGTEYDVWIRSECAGSCTAVLGPLETIQCTVFVDASISCELGFRESSSAEDRLLQMRESDLPSTVRSCWRTLFRCCAHPFDCVKGHESG